VELGRKASFAGVARQLSGEVIYRLLSRLASFLYLSIGPPYVPTYSLYRVIVSQRLSDISSHVRRHATLTLSIVRHINLSGVSTPANATNVRKVTELAQWTQGRKGRKNRKLQPIGTELSSFLLNSFLRLEILKKINSPNFSTLFTCSSIYDANKI